MTTNPLANSMNNEKGVARAMVYAAAVYSLRFMPICPRRKGSGWADHFHFLGGGCIDIEIEMITK